MPSLLRLHITKAPPSAAAFGTSFNVAISVTDDLGLQVYFGANSIPLVMSVVDAESYRPIDGLSVIVTCKSQFEISPTGHGLVSAQVALNAIGKGRSGGGRSVRLVVEVDPRKLVPGSTDGSGDNLELGGQSVPSLVGSTGILLGDGGSFLPLRVISGAIQVLPTGKPPSTDKLQDCERHFFLRFQQPNGQTSDPVCKRIAITEHAHMTFSTGTHVWDCSPVVSAYVAATARRWFPSFDQDVDVIELGAGCGLVGIVAAMAGGKVIVTDLDDPHESALEANVEHGRRLIEEAGSKGEITARSLSWGDLDQHEVTNLFPSLGSRKRPLLILGADVLYNAGSHDAFVATLLSLTRERTHYDILIGYKRRGAGDDAFFAKVVPYFQVDVVGSAWDVEIFWLQKQKI